MHSLRTRLSLSILFVVLITIVSIGRLSSWLVNRQFVAYITQQARIHSEDVVNDLGQQYNGLTRNWNLDYLHAVGMYALNDGYILKVYDASGNTIWDTETHDMTRCQQMMAEITSRMEAIGNTEGFTGHSYDIISSKQRVGSVSIKYYGGYFFSENDLKFRNALNRVLTIIGFVACLFSVIMGWVLARWIARPITRVAHIAKQIARGNYNIRFEGKTKTTELNDLGAAINQLAISLNEQEALRKQMTADVAHELRTPLATIGSHLEAMIDGVWEPTPERLKSCHEETARLTKMVADLERLAKMEGNILRLEKSSVDLMEIVCTVCENLKIEADRKNLSLNVEGESSLVDADRDRMSQVITNLLTNAIKYTPEGGSIKAAVYDHSQSGLVQIRDTGIGIAEKELPLIFERFYRTDKSRNRSTGGVGIGLAIVKSIMTAHNGTVMVESQPDKGSCFTIMLPK